MEMAGAFGDTPCGKRARMASWKARFCGVSLPSVRRGRAMSEARISGRLTIVLPLNCVES